MPLSEECHEKRLRDRGIYKEKQIEYTLMRAEMYKSYNQNHPGFFDMMIDSGRLDLRVKNTVFYHEFCATVYDAHPFF
ncbi:hypothetical protein DPMN_120979 [Dreissena polymorpha]|uniref:Uncharacterized protein n=1 Tax=Dreissena polymorpha TaxID=45954 RepID=A0A9D4JP25_DREPO|nr:hypothetical protein DPMN_120979 [Dreissena polymorpha]